MSIFKRIITGFEELCAFLEGNKAKHAKVAELFKDTEFWDLFGADGVRKQMLSIKPNGKIFFAYIKETGDGFIDIRISSCKVNETGTEIEGWEL